MYNLQKTPRCYQRPPGALVCVSNCTAPAGAKYIQPNPFTDFTYL